MKAFSNYFGISSILYLLVLVINTLWELFHISKTSSSFTTTLLGITIDNRLSDTEIATTFGLTSKTFIIYIIFLSIVFLILFVFKKKNVD